MIFGKLNLNLIVSFIKYFLIMLFIIFKLMVIFIFVWGLSG